MALSSLESLHLTEYPKEWYYTSDPSMRGLANESFMRRMEKLESAYEKAGIVPRPILDRERGELISQQYPSPSPQNAADQNKIWIQVVKGNPGKQEFKTIELDRLREFEAEGWQRWRHAGRPMKKEGSDADPRKILKIEDVWTTDAPLRIPLAFLPQESRRHVAKMALVGSQANFLDWIPWRKPSFLILRLLSPPPSHPTISSQQPRAVIYPSFHVQQV